MSLQWCYHGQGQGDLWNNNMYRRPSFFIALNLLLAEIEKKTKRQGRDVWRDEWVELISTTTKNVPGLLSILIPLSSARNYRPCFRENQPIRSFSIKWKRAFWACFRENWVYKFGHRGGLYVHMRNSVKDIFFGIWFINNQEQRMFWFRKCWYAFNFLYIATILISQRCSAFIYNCSIFLCIKRTLIQDQ